MQKDPAARNILAHPDRPGMTWTDFERATLFTLQVTLGSLSANKIKKNRSLGFTTGLSFIRETSHATVLRTCYRGLLSLSQLLLVPEAEIFDLDHITNYNLP